MRVILLSIKPKYGYAILEGKKKYELRKCVNAVIRPGDVVLMYFSSPVKAILGCFRAGKVYVASPEEIERIVRSLGDVGVDDEDLSYIRGFRKVMAIEVKDPRPCRKVSLERLRELNIRPPISYQPLTDDVAKILLKECGIDYILHEHGQGDRGATKEEGARGMAAGTKKIEDFLYSDSSEGD
ncbi:MAG: hypothetical protein GXO23_05010 [Crenarchaeota archaeon]|nr:hypothetical protein [Thermoproteota archaeon]